MKKSFVKILTVALAAATVASFAAMPAFAATNVVDTWTATSTTAAKTVKTIKVSGVADTSSELKVTAYQIVKGDYDANGNWTKYVLCDDTNAKIADVTNPTAAEVTAIANAINDDQATLTGITMTKSGNDYVADVEAGLYIVLVTGAGAVVYNPALVAVNIADPYDVANTASDGSVSMNNESKFTYKDGEGISTTAYAKSSEPGFNKDIVGSSMENTEGDVVAYGDTVSFEIKEMTIPSYSDDYKTSLVYKIEDKLDADAFKGIKDIEVKVGGEVVTAGDTTFTLTYDTATTAAADATAFTVAFKDAFIRANGQKTVEITYKSTLIDGTTVNYAEHKNTAKLSYSNDPTDSSKVKEKTDTTYHYTFGIDADLDAQGADDHADDETPYVPVETYELNKVTKGADTYEEKDSTKTSTKTQASKSAIAGALFGLYKSEADMNADTATTADDSSAFKTAESDTNGHIQFKGLDTGTYFMKELKAPEDYSLNTSVYKIEIKATLNDEGVLTQYSIETALKKSDGTYETARTATYTNTPAVVKTEENIDITSEGRVTNTIVQNVNETEIINTKIASLPATGGAGTIAITIGAAVGMAGFMTLYITNKKKKKSEND